GERDALERARPGSTALAFRHAGLSARDLAQAARSGRGPRAGLPAAGRPLEPLYVRSAQAEERGRHKASAGEPLVLRPFRAADVAQVAAVEREVFSDPWPEAFFRGELTHSGVYAMIAERGGRLAGYLLAWLAGGSGHIGNLATVPGERRRGVARRLLEDLVERASVMGLRSLTLEVRVSNFAAQALYRAHGFRVPARTYLQFLVDPDSFDERFAALESADPLEFRDAKMRYPERLQLAQKDTGMKDAALAGVATIGGKPVALAVMDFFFMGGSMGSVVGEKVARSIEGAIAERRALVVVSATGGA